jgi:hypothetical protein
MLESCGLLVHNDPASLWVKRRLTHSPLSSGCEARVKPASYTSLYAQLGTILYTLYSQFYNTFVSVMNRLVHTIHIAYKEDSEAKKGII